MVLEFDALFLNFFILECVLLFCTNVKNVFENNFNVVIKGTFAQLKENLDKNEDTLLYVIECHDLFLAEVHRSSEIIMSESTYQSIRSK